MSKFESDALLYSQKNNLFKRGDSIVIALSGGADSVALLSFFKAIESEYDLKLSAFHLNHNLRGEEALRDERFSKDISEKLKVPFSSAVADIAKIAREQKKGTEEVGREVRYQYLSKLGTDKIATAHNKNDLVETFFMNILRGSSTAGLASIPIKRGNIIRPLLCKSREEIEEYLEEKGLSYVDDSSNDSDIYFRNKIRHEIMPKLKELSPDFLDKTVRVTEAIAEDEQYLCEIANKLISDNSIETQKLLSQPTAIAKRAVRQLLKNNNVAYDSKRIELILSCAKAGSGAVNVSGDVFCEIFSGKLYIYEKKQKNNSVFEVLDFSDIVFSNKQVKFKRCQKKEIDNKLLRYAISCDKIKGVLSVRARNTGDRFEYQNRAGTKTLKKLFNEQRIPKWERDERIIIADDAGVLWVEGIGTASRGFGGEEVILIEITGVCKDG